MFVLALILVAIAGLRNAARDLLVQQQRAPATLFTADHEQASGEPLPVSRVGLLDSGNTATHIEGASQRPLVYDAAAEVVDSGGTSTATYTVTFRIFDSQVSRSPVEDIVVKLESVDEHIMPDVIPEEALSVTSEELIRTLDVAKTDADGEVQFVMADSDLVFLTTADAPGEIAMLPFTLYEETKGSMPVSEWPGATNLTYPLLCNLG